MAVADARFETEQAIEANQIAEMAHDKGRAGEVRRLVDQRGA